MSDIEDNDFDLDDWKAKKNSSYEERILKQVMSAIGVREKISLLKSRCQEVTGSYNLNWDWFNDEFPTFPVRLMVRSIPYVHTVTLLDLFQRFSKTPIYKGYCDAIDLYGESDAKADGLVFNWPGVGSMCFHTFRVDFDTSESRFSRRIGEKTFVLEKLGSLLDSVLEVWSP